MEKTKRIRLSAISLVLIAALIALVGVFATIGIGVSGDKAYAQGAMSFSHVDDWLTEYNVPNYYEGESCNLPTVYVQNTYGWYYGAAESGHWVGPNGNYIAGNTSPYVTGYGTYRYNSWDYGSSPNTTHGTDNTCPTPNTSITYELRVPKTNTAASLASNSGTYGSVSVLPTINYSNVSSGDTVTDNGTWSPSTYTGAGTYTYTVGTLTSGSDKYNLTNSGAQLTFTVNKANNPLSFTATQSVNKTFSTSSQTATLTAATNGQGTVTYAINSQKNSSNANVSFFSISGTTLTLAANTTADTYTVVVRASAAGNENYNSGTKDSTVTVTVSRANITPSVTMSGWTYGQSASNPSVSGNTGNGTVTYQYKVSTADDSTYSSTVPSDAGTYTVKATVAQTTNYNGNAATANFTITKATPAYTVPANLSATYGQTLTNVVLATGWTWDAPATSVGNVGSHDFAATFTPADTNNYNTVAQNLTVTVNKATPVYTVPTGLEATYGQSLADVALTTGWTWDAPATSVGNVGSHDFAATFTPADTNNYNTVAQNLTVTVNAKSVIVTPDDKTITYGDANVALTYAVSGLVGSDTLEGLTISRVEGNDAGTYDITVTHDDEQDTNYDVTITDTATYTIQAKAITVTITAKNSVYGSEPVALTATDNGIVEGDDNVYSLTCEVTAASAVGSYNIVGTALDDNYVITFVGGENAYTVEKKIVTVAAKAKVKTYGEADPELTYTVSGLLEGDVVTGELGREEGNGVGTYDITLGTLSAGDNYTVTYTGAVLTINKKSLVIKADDVKVICGNEPKAFTSTFNGLVNGDKASDFGAVTYDCDYTTESTIGVYPITPGGVTNSNYDIVFVPGNLSARPAAIEQKAVQVTIEGDDEGFDLDITLVVEVKTAKKETEQVETSMEIPADKLEKNSRIAVVYSVKLVRTTTTNGVETEEEIQPENIEPGTNIVIAMQVPEELADKDFSIMHIHSEDDIEYVDYTREGNTVYVTVDRLSDFAFITKVSNADSTTESETTENNSTESGKTENGTTTESGVVVGASETKTSKTWWKIYFCDAWILWLIILIILLICIFIFIIVYKSGDRKYERRYGRLGRLGRYRNRRRYR